MNKVQVVIEIDKNTYNRIQEDKYGSYQISHCMKSIKNGTVLPEHGDLIDRQELIKTAYEYREDTVSITEIKYAPTILETTKEGE